VNAPHTTAAAAVPAAAAGACWGGCDGLCVHAQRDVPGLTRAAIPVLVGKGVRAVSVGVNPGSAPPGVPQYTPFIWRDEESGTQLIAFWRPGGRG
jgi:hypothetical protein